MRYPNKKMNTLFLVMIASYLLTSFCFAMLNRLILPVNVGVMLVGGELAVLIPGLIFLLLFHCNIAEWIPIRRVRGSTIAFTLLLTLLIQPVLYLLNVASQLFESNKVADLLSETEDIPGAVLLIVIGVFAPFCEETVFRGILFTGLKRTNRIFGAILWTSIMFGLFHMNLNQLGYAVVLGFAAAILVEVTGSMVPALLMHALTNTYNVSMALWMRLVTKLAGEDFSAILAEGETVGRTTLLLMSGVLLIPAAGGIVLSVVVIRAIARREGTMEHLLQILPFTKQKDANFEQPIPKSPVVTPTGIIGAAICLLMIFALETIMKLVG